MRAPFAIATLMLLLAGCVTPPEETPTEGGAPVADPATWDAIRALMADVPCEAEVGADTSANMLELGKLQLEEGDIGEIDVRGDIALLSRHALGGLTVVDIADPRAPTILGVLPIDETSALDLKWIPDGSGAIIGADGKLFVVDLADLTAPAVVAEADVPTQAHMVTPWTFEDGRTFVYVASQTTNMPAFVYEMEGWNLTMVGSFGMPTGPLTSLPLGNHDITIYEDEILGAPTLYMADGLAGWNAWSLDEPAAPQRIGGSIGQELGVGYVHTVRVGFYDGMRLVVTMQEVGQNTLKIYDATDLNVPVLLARWNADATSPQAPQHNIQLLGDWLFLAHYTHGVYAFNISEVRSSPPLVGTASIAPVGHFAVEDPAEGGPLGFANVWDVAVRRGVLHISDLTGSLTAVGFGCLAIGDASASAVE